MPAGTTDQSAAERATTVALETVSGALWSLRANLMSDIVDQHGAVKSLRWFAQNMPTYEKILRTWGPLRTHHLAVAVSATNGCSYCTYGHAYAFCLHWFDQNNELYPLSEHDMRELGNRDGNEVVSELESALRATKQHGEIPWLHRIAALTNDPDPARPTTRDDEWLHHLVAMFGWLNGCGIEARTTIDEAHDPINKNLGLRHRYDEARAASLR